MVVDRYVRDAPGPRSHVGQGSSSGVKYLEVRQGLECSGYLVRLISPNQMIYQWLCRYFFHVNRPRNWSANIERTEYIKKGGRVPPGSCQWVLVRVKFHPIGFNQVQVVYIIFKTVSRSHLH